SRRRATARPSSRALTLVHVITTMSATTTKNAIVSSTVELSPATRPVRRAARKPARDLRLEQGLRTERDPDRGAAEFLGIDADEARRRYADNPERHVHDANRLADR